jgi:hypothetical protein
MGIHHNGLKYNKNNNNKNQKRVRPVLMSNYHI